MKSLRVLTVSLLCLSLALNVSAMNTISSRCSSTTEQSELNRTRVIDRLVEVGYNEEEAIARVDNMTCDEAEYLAEHPESIKRSGIIIFSSLIGSSVYSSANAKKQKKEAYKNHLQDKIASFRMEMTILNNDRMKSLSQALTEQDPAKKEAAEAESERLEKEIDSMMENIQKLENEISTVNNPKSKTKVPASKDFDKRVNEILEQETI